MRFAEESFYTQNPPPYKLTDKTIILHPLWRDYFKRNMKIVWCWALCTGRTIYKHGTQTFLRSPTRSVFQNLADNGKESGSFGERLWRKR